MKEIEFKSDREVQSIIEKLWKRGILRDIRKILIGNNLPNPRSIATPFLYFADMRTESKAQSYSMISTDLWERHIYDRLNRLEGTSVESVRIGV